MSQVVPMVKIWGPGSWTITSEGLIPTSHYNHQVGFWSPHSWNTCPGTVTLEHRSDTSPYVSPVWTVASPPDHGDPSVSSSEGYGEALMHQSQPHGAGSTVLITRRNSQLSPRPSQESHMEVEDVLQHQDKAQLVAARLRRTMQEHLSPGGAVYKTSVPAPSKYGMLMEKETNDVLQQRQYHDSKSVNRAMCSSVLRDLAIQREAKSPSRSHEDVPRDTSCSNTSTSHDSLVHLNTMSGGGLVSLGAQTAASLRNTQCTCICNSKPSDMFETATLGKRKSQRKEKPASSLGGPCALHQIKLPKLSIPSDPSHSSWISEYCSGTVRPVSSAETVHWDTSNIGQPRRPSDGER